ncbi:MAG: helix-turn-helix domain-containing protein [Bdellovibrionales bacterium]
MGRKMIVVSDDNQFIVSAKAFCETNGATIQVHTAQEWSQKYEAPKVTSVSSKLMGLSEPLSTGASPVNEGAKILQFPVGGMAGLSSQDGRVSTINELESVAIQNAIMSFNGNLTEAAKALGIGRATLYRKVKQYKIDPTQARRKKAA